MGDHVSGLVTCAYLGALTLFILALSGLSHQERARQGNLFGVIGMTVAVLATVLSRVSNNAWVLARGPLHRRRGRTPPRAARQDDPDAGAYRHAAQLRGHGRGAHRLRELPRCPDARTYSGRRTPDPRHRDSARHSHRRGHLYRLGNRVRQALRPHQRQTDGHSLPPARSISRFSRSRRGPEYSLSWGTIRLPPPRRNPAGRRAFAAPGHARTASSRSAY